MRNLLRTLHLSVALVAAPFVVVLGVTGSIMAFEPELDGLLHNGPWHVNPEARVLTLDELIAHAAQAFPDAQIERVDLSASPDLAYRLALRGKPIYMNQYTGQTIGLADTRPTWLARIHRLHVRLPWMSHPVADRNLVRWMSVAMLFLLLTGVYLWWPLQRITIDWRASKSRRWLDVHAVTGITAFAFLLVLGLTGVVIGFEDVAKPWLYRLTGSAPSKRPPHVVLPLATGPIPAERAMAIARATLPGATPFRIEIPETDGTYLISLRFPEDLTPGGRSRVEVDQYTGAVVFAEGSRTAPAGTRAVNLNRAIHTGDVFGLVSKVVASLASALSVVMAVSGVLTWWYRRRGRGPR